MRQLLVAVLMAVLSAATVCARTWHVEKDGSGDFVIIQDALDIAASGDTVRIGPGRFEDYRPYTFPGGDYILIAYVAQENMTIIGSGADSTIIGPPTYSEPYPDPYPTGIHYWGTSPSGLLVISDLRVENQRTGIYGISTPALLEVHNCTIANGIYGIQASGPLVVSGSRFVVSVPPGAVAPIGSISRTASPAEYDNCDFIIEGDCIGVQFQQAVLGLVRECTFSGNGTDGGAIAFVSAEGGVYDSDISRVSVGIDIAYSNSIELRGNTISAREICVNSDTEGIRLSDNILQAQEGPVLNLWAVGAVHQYHNNHILRGSGFAARIAGDAYAPANYHIDMTNNWWGTTDRDSIAAWIWDRTDPAFPILHTTVDFEPFASGPVPNEGKSLGSLKALFLGR